ncbi:MAG: NADH-quinone oxidoreductase subunit G [Micromonosporaceae bacterium]|nr:NADH-quinone oxidoreductase subunit G [Micromonosporaceae bacterium]
MTDTVKITIDGVEVETTKGALIIRVAEEQGIDIPRFCDHPLLDPVGACRQCLVEVAGQRKPMTACTLTAADGLVVNTQHTSETARDAQRGIMEFLLINHPLDCPVCDKGGECPLQNQAMSAGRAESRFIEQKRIYQKPTAISSQILLDRERCVLCQRCTRFCAQIAGDQFIDLMERGADQQIGIAENEPFNSYFSGNTIQICPVGALTGVQYRFRSRPFDLVSAPSICEHCAAGCAQRTDHRRGAVLRRLAGDDPAVNEEWNCDKGRWAFQYVTAADRIAQPMVRDPDTGELRPATWPEAFEAAAAGLSAARASGGVGVLTGGRLTVEDSYAYAKFARTVLGTNDIDFRTGPASEEESQFLASSVVGRAEVTYGEVEAAPAVVLVGLDPEEECPILFLRLFKARRGANLRVVAVAPFASRGLEKLGATVVQAVPGEEPSVLDASVPVREALEQPGAILLVGERLAGVRGGLSAAATLARATGARMVWVPRRAGDRGALEAGCLPNLLPGGRPVADAAAMAEIERAWGLGQGTLPGVPGRTTEAIVAAAGTGELGGLLIAGVDLADLADPVAATEAVDRAGFVVSCELRRSEIAERADVVFPVAAAPEKAGVYINWEGRVRPFEAVLPLAGSVGVPARMSDARVLDAIAAALGSDLGCGDLATLRRELSALADMPLPGAASTTSTGTSASSSTGTSASTGSGPASRAARQQPPQVEAGAVARPGPGMAVLATWQHLLDLGSMQAGDGHLAGTARQPVARISKATAAGLGASDGDLLVIGTDRGEISLPVLVTDLPDGVVWVPANSPGSTVGRTLGVASGALVTIALGGGK